MGFDHPGWDFGSEVGAVVEEAEGPLDDDEEVYYDADDLVGVRVVSGLFICLLVSSFSSLEACLREDLRGCKTCSQQTH